MTPSAELGGRRPGRCSILAGLAGVLSLGLAWASAMDLKYRVPWYPGFCHVSYDSEGWASTQLRPVLDRRRVHASRRPTTTSAISCRCGSWLRPPCCWPSSASAPGGRWLVRAAAVCALAGLVVGGLRVYPGQVAYVIALVAAGTWLVRAGHLDLRGRAVE